jgi:hypothetical protein
MQGATATGPGGDYYSVLGVEPGATLEQIRAAYRKLALRFHPDRNRSENAEKSFQSVSEAYATLANARRRVAYDRALLAKGVAARPQRLAPICCSECGRATAQPRILTFQYVTSYLVWSKVRSTEGIFCAGCGKKEGLRASARSAAMGWWSPMGLILTPYTIALNAVGGRRQRAADQKLLLLNAEAFLAVKEARLAYALAQQVRRSGEAPLAERALSAMLQAKALDETLRDSRLADPWKLSFKHVSSHALLALSAPVVLAAAALVLH